MWNVFGELVLSENVRHWAVADFNGDGKDDLFFADHGLEGSAESGVGEARGGQSWIFIQNDFGQLIDETSSRIPQLLAITHNISTGDIDLYMGHWIGHTPFGLESYINYGNGYFERDPTRIPRSVALTGFSAGLLVDVDNDLDLDLVLGYPARANRQNDPLLLNDGGRNFDLAPQDSLPLRLGDVEEVAIGSADINQDGWPDLVFAVQRVFGSDPYKVWKDPELQLLINNGDGIFGRKRRYGVLQLGQFISNIARQQIAPRRNCLAKLDEYRPQLFKREPDSLAERC